MRTIIPPDAALVPKEAKRVFKGIIYDVYHWQQKMFDGSFATFEMLKRPDTIKILAIKDNKIVVLDEEQPGIKRMSELPGGRHDVEAEDERICAAREMHEETGMVFKNYTLLAVHQPHVKIETFVYLFLATDFERQDPPHVDNGEKIVVHFVDYNEYLRLSRDPQMGKYLWGELVEKAGSIEGLLALAEH